MSKFVEMTMEEFLKKDNFDEFADSFRQQKITQEFMDIVKLQKKDIRHYVCLKYLIDRKIEKLTRRN
ncbi:hypothetical protein [Pantoea sp. MBLJ3]|uniref:hypothetical protein n=1 Tax=Pantoea sp. MBLJ3 TaxID=1562889 RepID=UPI00057CF641|nr:hypothetical protein [Pantoea sp. MBLJ3]